MTAAVPRLSAASTLLRARSPEALFAKGASLGDPFYLRLPGTGDILLSGRAQAAKEIFTARRGTFEPPQPNPIEPLLGAHSLILLSGDAHTKARKLLVPAFLGERMRSYRAIMQQAARDICGQWTTRRGIDVLAATQAITLEVIVRAVFGIQGAERKRMFSKAIVEMSRRYTPPLFLMPSLRRPICGGGPWVRFVRAREAFDRLLMSEVQSRRESGTDRRPDVLSLLLGLRYDDGEALADEEILDQLRTLLVAGHETTATALAWSLHHVAGDDSVYARLKSEVCALDDHSSADALADAAYLSAVCQEALRLYPSVPLVLRRLKVPFRFMGHDLSAGSTVAVAITLLHRDASVWTDANRFDPDRFMNRRFGPFEFAPFGGGDRRCLGAAFAIDEMKVVLGTIVKHATFERRSGPDPRRVIKNITMGPVRVPLIVGPVSS